MIIIALLKHFSSCFERYKTRRKLSSLSHDLRKDLGIMQDSFEAEVGKGNLFTFLKELSFVSKIDIVKKSRFEGK